MAFNPEAKIKRQVALKKKLWVTGVGTTLALLYTVIPQFRSIVNAPFIALTHDRKIAATAVERPRYNPPQTPDYKNSYTDNVLKTTKYSEFKRDKQVQDKWILELNKFLVESLKLDENSIVRFIAIENRLVGGLADLKKEINPKFEQLGIQHMRTLEIEAVKEMKDVLGGDNNFKALRNFEQSYFESKVATFGESSQASTLPDNDKAPDFDSSEKTPEKSKPPKKD